MCADSGAAETCAGRCGNLPAMGDINAATVVALGRVPADDAPLSDRERLHVWAALYFSQGQTSTAEVTAAKELTDAQRDKLAESLKASVGKDVKFSMAVDESLIGGLVVKVGSKMIDTSIASKLGNLQNAMKEVG